MTSERIINAVAAFLKPKIETAGGVFSLSETVANTISLLGGSAGRFRVILQWQRESGDEPRGQRTMTMLIIVQHGGQNLGVNPGDAVTVQRPSALSATTVDSGGPLTVDSTTAGFDNAPLMQRCTQVCKWARSIRFTNKDIQQAFPQMKPGASYWLNDPSFPTKQIAHEFMVQFGLDGVTLEDVTA